MSFKSEAFLIYVYTPFLFLRDTNCTLLWNRPLAVYIHLM